MRCIPDTGTSAPQASAPIFWQGLKLLLNIKKMNHHLPDFFSYLL
jgi:hypothetical protein